MAIPLAAKKQNILTQVHVSGKEREYFTDNLALLLKAGVAVGEALQSMQDTAATPRLARSLEELKHDIDEGVPLHQALERHNMASRQTLALIELGEQSGKLVDNLRVAAKQEQKQRMFRSKVRSALLYPTFVLSMTLVVGLGVAWFLLPRLSETFSQLDVTLPLISKVFIGFGTFLKHNGLWAIPLFFVVLAGMMYMLFGHPKTRKYGQRVLMHIPGVSKLIREVEISRFGYLLGTLLDAGLSVTQALELLGRATTSIEYQKLYAHLHRAFEEGYSFSSSLPKYKGVNKLLPPAVQQMVIAGEHSGALAETLSNIGTIYEQKADVSTANLEAVLEPILLVIVWVGVMGVAVSVILPIYSLVGGLEQ